MIWLKLTAVPLVVWVASWIGKRWGHKASGWISGLPMIAAPITLFLALDQPREFVLATSWIAMTVAPAVGVHCLVFAWLATAVTRTRMPPALIWITCLLAGWGGCVVTELLLAEVVAPGFVGAAVAVTEMLLLGALMPVPRTAASIPRIPASEIFVRMGAALFLAALITLGAKSFGPRVSGILLGFPITASVLPAFTVVLYGADATIRLLSGFLTGLIGFVLFFFAFSTVLAAGAAPLAAFGAGVAASVVSAGAMMLWHRLRFARETA
ncbi:MAG TPA: hypothetical protein VGN52_09200 [Burkholderiales bacterium]|jgi:hypothetical protein